jgi:urease accessory protein
MNRFRENLGDKNMKNGKTLRCEKILGTLKDFPGKKLDPVTVEWHETRKKLHRKESAGGVDIAVFLDDAALPRGLRQDDVLALEDETVFAVDIPAFEVLVIRAANPKSAQRACWETGNKHAPLFWGDAEGEFITPYDGPLAALLGRLEGLEVETQSRKVDFSRALSGGAASGHGHGGHGHHPHGHEH